MKNMSIVMFNAEGQKKFSKTAERMFLYVGDVANNPDYIIVKGFRGNFLISEEMFIERRDEMYELTAKEIEQKLTSK